MRNEHCGNAPAMCHTKIFPRAFTMTCVSYNIIVIRLKNLKVYIKGIPVSHLENRKHHFVHDVVAISAR